MFNFLYTAIVAILDSIIWFVDFGPGVHRIFLAPGVGKFRVFLGKVRAVRVYRMAVRRVPAYRDYLSSKKYHAPRITARGADLGEVPETDKASYIKEYFLTEKLIDGVLPKAGVMLDESSGSSGKPTNWARGAKERRFTSHIIQVVFNRLFKGQNVIVINTFAMGAWSTGLNTSLSLLEIGRVKSTGPDLTKAIDTLLDLGIGFDYVICGYPPFLKQIADDKRVQWDKYSVSAIYGGEGISEPMRKSLKHVFKDVIGSYGASDLEINVASETNFTIALRQALIEDEKLRSALVKQDRGIVPMIFQYNPYDYLIETNVQGELLVTICRLQNLSPRIRYNIHDLGHPEEFYPFKKRLEALGRHDLTQLAEFDFGVLFYYGRSDLSVDYYGAVISPEEIRQIIDADEEYKLKVSSFRLISYEDIDHQKHLLFALEAAKDMHIDAAEVDKMLSTVIEQLFRLNLDFKAGYQMANYKPEIRTYANGEGIFDLAHQSVKNSYVWNIDYDRAKSEGLV